MKRTLILATILATWASAFADDLTMAKAIELGRKYTAALYANDTATSGRP